MFGFMLKKAFFDYWDNFFHMAILNMLMVFTMAIPFGLPSLIVSFSPALSLVVMILGILLLGLVTSAVSLYINEIAQFRTVGPKQFFGFFKSGWKTGLVFSLVWLAVVLLVWITFPFYSTMESILAFAALAFLFWTLVVFVLAMQYFFPVTAQLEDKLPKVFRKIFLIFFDNVAFSIFLFIISAVLLLVSGFTAFLLWGPAGVILTTHVALRLRLYKYDYYEEHPEQKSRRVPWAALIHEDRQRIGHRSLKGMIFPWKD